MFNEIVQICDLTKCKGSLKSKPKQNSGQRKVGFFSNYYITNYFCGVRLISLWMIFHVHAACVTGWITALVSLSVRLMSGSCQTSFLLCTIFLFGSNARLITACFLLLSGSCQALYCSVQFGSCPVDVRPTSGSNVWLCLGPCLARHFLTGIILWQYIFNVQ